MKKIIFIVSAIFEVAFLSGIVSGQAPDFSGTWRLNHAKSNYGEIGPLPDMTYEIRHEGLRLTVRVLVERSENERRDMAYTTDGRECLNNGEGLRDLKSTCRIDGGKILIQGEAEGATAMSSGGNDPEIRYFKYNMTQVFSLSPDRSVLTIVSKLDTNEGPKNIALVFDRK